jgi:hypothetical protein
MNKNMLLLAFQILCLQAAAQDKRWQKIYIDDSTTVDFPGTPKKKLVAGRQATFFRDDKVIYSVIVKKDIYGGNLIDSELKKFYDGTLKGMVNAFGGGEVIEEKEFIVNGFSGRQFQLITPAKLKSPRIKSARVLLVNGTFYTTNFWTNTEQDPHVDSARNRFFLSFRTSMKRTAAVDPGTQTQAYKLGSLMGSLFFYGALVAVFVAIVRRFSRPKAA